ncbi:MAG: thioredoxin family protein [Bacillota bacterium]
MALGKGDFLRMNDRGTLRRIYREGLTFEEFVARAGRRGELFRRNYRDTEVPLDIRGVLAALPGAHGGLRLLVMAEAGCPDAAENVPVLARLSEASADVQLRCFFRDEHLDLDAAFRDSGAERIPALFVCTAGFEVLGIWQERPAPAHRVIQAIRERRDEGQSSSYLAARLRRSYQTGEFRRATMEEVLALMKAQ